MTDANTFVAGATARQPQRLVIATAESLDEVQATGAWIAAAPDAVVEVRR